MTSSYSLGQFAADGGRGGRRRSVAQRAQHRLQPVRGLEEHHGAPLGGQVRQPRGALPGFARQETLEGEAVGGQAGQRQRREHGGRARGRR